MFSLFTFILVILSLLFFFLKEHIVFRLFHSFFIEFSLVLNTKDQWCNFCVDWNYRTRHRWQAKAQDRTSTEEEEEEEEEEVYLCKDRIMTDKKTIIRADGSALIFLLPERKSITDVCCLCVAYWVNMPLFCWVAVVSIFIGEYI